MGRRKTVFIITLVIAVLILFTACEQNNSVPMAKSITVQVSDNTGAKTISPSGNVNVSHYVITVSNQDTGDSFRSEYLEKGQAFSVLNVAVGTWTAKVDAYVQNEYAADGYVHIATAVSDPVRVSVDSEAKITVVLDEILAEQSDDVSITLMLPSDFIAGSNAYVTWALDGDNNDYSISWDKALELQVSQNRTVSFTLDADNLLGGSEQLMQGVYTISVEVADSKETAGQSVVKKGVEVLRLLAGLPASGVINLSAETIVPDGADITIVEQIGDQLQLGASATVEDQLVTVDLIYNGIPFDSEIKVYIDGEKFNSFELEDTSSGKRVVISDAPEGEHLIMFTIDEGTAMGTGSLTIKVDVPEKVFEFSLNGNSYTVTGLAESIGDFEMPASGVLEIPASHQGKTVTEIDTNAFRDRTDIVGSVVIPDSVTEIGEFAFYGCSSLETVEISDASQLTSIGSYAFLGCSALTNINIPDTITSIESGVFYYCSSLTNIDIPDSVISIKNHAFYDCSSLTSITIPDSVMTIGVSAFSDCSALKTVEISDTSQLESIGSDIFARCTSLKSINIPDRVSSIGARAFWYCSSLESIDIPDGVMEIKERLFFECTSITSINIPNSVTSIGNEAFRGCSALTSINIPEGVTSITTSAFSGCSALTSINIPDGVTSIGEGAFRGCSALTSINIPEGVTTIGSGAFEDCSALTSINIPVGVTSIEDFTFRDCSALTYINIPVNVTQIGESAFSGCSLSGEVIIPENVVKIGEEAFGYNTGTGGTLIIKGTSVLEPGVFANSNLRIDAGEVLEKHVAGGGTTIPHNLFFGCTNLVENVVIPEGIAKAEHAAFGSSNIESIIFPESLNELENAGTAYADQGHRVGGYGVLTNCSMLQNVTLPSNLVLIGSYTFSGCSALESLVVPNNVTLIGINAFKNCSSLTDIYCEASSQPEEWDAEWLGNCTATVHWGYTGE